jgi:hypothetical protein
MTLSLGIASSSLMSAISVVGGNPFTTPSLEALDIDEGQRLAYESNLMEEAPPEASTAVGSGDDGPSVADQLNALRAEMTAQRVLLESQSKLIAEQQLQIRALIEQKQQLAESDALLQDQRGVGAPVGTTASVMVAQNGAVTGGAPAQTVGEAPPEDHDISPKITSVPEGQGVLTPKGRTILETSFEYSRSSKNRLVFRGFELIPGLQVGLIEASDADRNTFAGTIAARHGLTNRLEIEARMPVLSRRDRIQVAQQRDEGIVREIKLKEYDLGDAEIGLRYQLNRAKGPDKPIYVANLRLKSTTGKGPFDVGYDEFGVATGLATGSGFWGLQGGGSFLLPSDPAVIYGGLSYLWHIPKNVNKTVGGAFIGRVDPGDAISGNLGFGFGLNPRFSFSLGYNHSLILPTKTEIGGTNQRSKSLHVGSLALGTSYRLSERQSVNLGFEFGMTSDAPDMSVTLRLPLRF